MPLTNAVLDGASNGAATTLGFAAIHSADNSAAQTSDQRIAVTWPGSSGGVITVAALPLSFTGDPGADASHLGFWSAISGGTYRGAVPLTGDQTFNAAGEYDVTALSLTSTNA